MQAPALHELTGTQSPSLHIPLMLVIREQLDMSMESRPEGRNMQDKGAVNDDNRGDLAKGSEGQVNKKKQKLTSRRTTVVSEKAGKDIAEDKEDFNNHEEECTRRKLIKILRQELKVVEEGRKGDAGKGGWVVESSQMGGGDSEALRIKKKAKKSHPILVGLGGSNPPGPTWPAIRDVPPLISTDWESPSGTTRNI
jgi:hypothetical protein